MKQNLSNLVVNVTVSAATNHTVQVYRHGFDISTNMLGAPGFDDPNSCSPESLGSQVGVLNIFYFDCRKIRIDTLHNYVAMFALCPEKFVDGHWMYTNCFRLPNVGMVAEFEESINEGSLAPLSLPLLGSFGAIAGVEREPVRTYLATSLWIFLAARLYGAQQEDVDVHAAVIRAELRYPMLILLGLQAALVLAITVWVSVKHWDVRQTDCFVVRAHIPSHAHEWALMAYNENTCAWPCGDPKPKEQKVGPSFGIIWAEGSYDYLGTTTRPKTTRNKPLKVGYH